MTNRFPTLAQLGAALASHLADRRMGLRAAEREFGISKATLSRASRGMNMTAQNYIDLAEKVWVPGKLPVDSPP